MDIQAAIRDGYTKKEVMAELGKRTGMDYKSALKDGHSPDDVLGELNKRDLPKVNPKEYAKKVAESPEYREQMANFIRKEAPRDMKREAVRGLPMGNRLADILMGTYNNPVHPERTVDAVLGPQTQSQTTGGAMLRGLGNLVTNPAPQIEGAIASPADFATGAYKAAVSPESGSLAKFGKETVKGIAAPTGLADLASGDMEFPEARAAWEQNALGSGLIAYGAARGAAGAGRSLKDLGAKTVEKAGLTPEKLYASSLKQSTTIPMEQRAANVKVGLEGGYVPNKKGLNRLYEDINGLNDQISTSIKESTTGGKTVNVESIINRLDDVKQRAIDSFGDNNNVLAKIEDFATSLRDHPAVKDGEIPVDIAQKMKVNTYKQLKNAYGELKGFEVEAKKAMARGAKEEIVSQIPGLAELNAKDSTLINLEKVLFKAVNRIENRDLVGIGVPIKIATGAMGGPKGAIIGALVGLIDTPAIKANLAIAMHKARGKRPTPSELDMTVKGIKASLTAKMNNEKK